MPDLLAESLQCAFCREDAKESTALICTQCKKGNTNVTKWSALCENCKECPHAAKVFGSTETLECTRCQHLEIKLLDKQLYIDLQNKGITSNLIPRALVTLPWLSIMLNASPEEKLNCLKRLKRPRFNTNDNQQNDPTQLVQLATLQHTLTGAASSSSFQALAKRASAQLELKTLTKYKWKDLLLATRGGSVELCQVFLQKAAKQILPPDQLKVVTAMGKERLFIILQVKKQLGYDFQKVKNSAELELAILKIFKNMSHKVKANTKVDLEDLLYSQLYMAEHAFIAGIKQDVSVSGQFRPPQQSGNVTVINKGASPHMNYLSAIGPDRT